MSFLKKLKRFFSGGIQLAPDYQTRLKTWHQLSKANLSQHPSAQRWVVIDVETSGLNLNRDRLISIGAIAVNNGMIDLNDTFEVVLKQEIVSNRENILIHGIGTTAQAEGVEPQLALIQFLEYLNNAPLVAFHAFFDRTMINRAIDEYLDFTFLPTWLDLAHLAPALYPELGRRFHGLDDWLTEFKIEDYARHNALSDAFSTAKLFLILLDQSHAANYDTCESILKIEQLQRWLTQKH